MGPSKGGCRCTWRGDACDYNTRSMAHISWTHSSNSRIEAMRATRACMVSQTTYQKLAPSRILVYDLDQQANTATLVIPSV